MTTLQKTARVLLAFALLFGANAIGRADDSDDETDAPKTSRWVIFIDAASNPTAENDAAREEFRNALIESGISEKNALVYSASAEDPAKRPTRETLDKLVAALRTPDDLVLLPGETQEIRFRDDLNGVCEAQVFLTGLGVANEETGKTYFAPSDVDESEIEGWDDPKLMSLETLEDALLFPEKGQKALERTFLVVSLNSPKTTSRGTGKDARYLKAFDPKRVPTRGSGADVDAGSFAHFRIATKNARYDERLAGSFYRTLRDGLEGSADVAGNQDGTVSAGELTTYLETTAQGTGAEVAVSRNGNDDYRLCKARKTTSIPSGVFADLAKTFTNSKYKKERAIAEQKDKAQKARQKKSVEAAKKGVVVK